MKSRNRSRLFLSWLLSYLFILIMPILISIFVYQRANQTIDQEVASVNRASLRQLQSLMDGSFQSFDRIVANLSLSNDVRQLLSAKEENSGKRIQNIIRVQDALSRHQLTDNMIDEILLYVDNQQIMVTGTYKYNSDEIARVCEQKLGMDYAELLTLIPRKNPPAFRISGGTESGSASKLLFMRPIYAYGYSRPAGLLIVKMKNAEFSRILNISRSVNDADIFVVNAQGEWYGSGYDQISAELRNLLSASPDGETYEFEAPKSGRITAAGVFSELADAEIVSMVSTDAYHQKSSEIRKIMAIYVLVCLVLGGGFAFLFTRINYYPVKRIRQLLFRYKPTLQQSPNEFRLVENTLSELLSQETEMKQFTEEKSRQEQNAILSQVLLGRISYDEKTISMLRKSFIRDQFSVVALRLSDPENKMSPPFLQEPESFDLIMKLIRDLGESVFSDHFSVAMVEVYGEPAFILNAAKEQKEVFGNAVSACLSLISDAVQNSVPVRISADVSTLHEGRTALFDAYMETMLVREYRLFKENAEDVLFYEAVSAHFTESDLRLISARRQRLFLNCLDSNDYTNAAAIFSEILDREPESVRGTKLKKAQLISYAGILLNQAIINAEGKEENSELAELERLYEDLLNENSSQSMRDKAISFFNHAVHALKAREQEKVPLCVRQAEQFADEHYTDASLNVSAIAEQLNLNVSYLSRTYKKARGFGLLDYIHRKRLDLAKTLIGDMSVSSVAEKAGYVDSKALISAFKKYEGTTPGKFRNTDYAEKID